MKNENGKREMKNLIIAVVAVAMAGCAGKSSPQKSGAAAEETRPLVKVGSVDAKHRFREVRHVQASLRAKESALVSARVPGTIDALFAEEGAKVEKGAKLFQVDRVNLENAVRAAEDDLRLARAKAREAEVTREKTRLDDSRMKRLSEENAVTRDAAEKAAVANARADAACDAAAAQITKAETALAIAKKNLADSIRFACEEGVSGVFIVFAGQAIAGTRARKFRSKSFSASFMAAFICDLFISSSFSRARSTLCL